MIIYHYLVAKLSGSFYCFHLKNITDRLTYCVKNEYVFVDFVDVTILFE